MREDWDNLKTVLFVVRHGSLAAAARVLGVSYTTVSRRIAAAEESFGARLFDRRQEGYIATDAGRTAAQYAEAMEDSETTLRRTLDGKNADLSGRLVITAPELLINAHLCNVFAEFQASYPNVDLTVRASNALLDLDKREADIAIRISRDPGDNLVGRRLTQQHTAAFATPELVAQMTEDPAAPVTWLGFEFWKDVPKNTRPDFTNQRIGIRFNDMLSVLGAARRGLGVARMPLFVGRSTDGLEMAPVMPPTPYMDIWALSHRDLRDSAKVQAFKSLLVRYFNANAGEFWLKGA